MHEATRKVTCVLTAARAASLVGFPKGLVFAQECTGQRGLRAGPPENAVQARDSRGRGILLCTAEVTSTAARENQKMVN